MQLKRQPFQIFSKEEPKNLSFFIYIMMGCCFRCATPFGWLGAGLSLELWPGLRSIRRPSGTAHQPVVGPAKRPAFLVVLVPSGSKLVLPPAGDDWAPAGAYRLLPPGCQSPRRLSPAKRPAFLVVLHPSGNKSVLHPQGVTERPQGLIRARRTVRRAMGDEPSISVSEPSISVPDVP